MEPVINLRGEKVGLGPLRRENVPVMNRWMNDFDVTRTLAAGVRPFTLEEQEKWFAARAEAAGREAIFHIYELSTGTLIGNCGLHVIDSKNGSAELGMLIGEKSKWGKGYATEACKLLLRYAFGELGLHNVMLRAYSENAGALKAYARAGFREFGRRRQSIQRGGKRYDEVYFDVLASEWRG